ncbi:uncharacterized protein LOC125884496 [Epinephelus fuscoguttatus]|uniref:uncharacterized protein LOC125884496 n=1 Tax=Epinephelus fuscoguttatus TaxID=293821 RepID=UPI0020D0E8AE|nr:uncharacterized protein LOC125884496 [Epinephelus fuscoguttatus]
MIFTLITALIFTCSLISVSVLEFNTVEVQPGEQVTLMCSNFTNLYSHIFWFRLTSRASIGYISSMTTPDTKALLRDGFQNGKFNMTSNTTTIFLTIQPVDVSDSGLYFCGISPDGKSVIDSATYLNVQECPHETTSLSVILGALNVSLIIIVTAMTVRICKLQTADGEEQNPQQSESLDSDDLKAAALSLYPASIRSRRPASHREVETRVMYAASR